MSPLTGTVTFVFTDIEGSTRLWEEAPEAMRPALARHDALVRGALEGHGGHVFKTLGDAFCAAFASAPEALAGALAAQLALAAEAWSLPTPLRARMAVHSGACEERAGDYFGPPLNRAARLLGAGHGGQTLVSQVTRGLILGLLPPRTVLDDLGEHRLRDLSSPEHVYQLRHPDLSADFPPLRTLEVPRPPNNLPQQLTSFIGRDKELAAVGTLLQRARLVTLTGTGGAGKSRLSLQIAARLMDQFADGVWLVELAPLAEGAQVPQALAQTLQVREQPGRTLTQTLCDFLQAKETLIIFDNCEHVLADSAVLVTGLLRACPKVRILTSSREALSVSGEHTYRVPSLSLADPRQPHTAQSLSQYDAATLFLQRARAVQPAFAVTAANASAIAQICWRLDGIPLAIELAAPRLRAMPVEQVMARLDDRFRLLTGGSRTGLPHQQTLRALIDWSYDLLSDQEQRLLRRLSVFSGGWTIDAAEAVCADDGLDEFDILDLLTRLVDKSLVMFEERDGRSRYHLLETLREYSRQRLQEAREDGMTHQRHRDWLLVLAEQAEPALRGPAQGEWLDRLEIEYGNLRAAMEWSAAHETAMELSARLTTSLWQFWWIRGHFTEGRECLMALLQRGGIGHGLEAKARVAAGLLSFAQYDNSVAIQLIKEGVALTRLARDPWLLGLSLDLLGFSLMQSDPEHAASHLAEALTLACGVDDPWLIAEVLSTQGHLDLFCGRTAQAKTRFEEAITLCRTVGDRYLLGQLQQQSGFVAGAELDWAAARPQMEESFSLQKALGDRRGMALSLSSLGHITLKQSDTAGARGFFLENLKLAKDLGDRLRFISPLEGLASVALARGEAERAAALFAAAAALRADTLMPEMFWTAHVSADRKAAQESLPDREYDRAQSRGREMTLEEAVEYAAE